MRPVNAKQVVNHMKTKFLLSERAACRLVGISRTGYRHKAKPAQDQPLRQRLQALATQYPRYGYLILHSLLKDEGLVINKKRTYRIYTEEGLQVRTKKRKKVTRSRMPMVVPIAKNIRWSMDFVSDQLSNGRRFRVFNIVDDYSREVIGQLADFSITGHQVARFIIHLGETRQLPDQIICDNGTEFTSKAMFFWQRDTGVKPGFI